MDQDNESRTESMSSIFISDISHNQTGSYQNYIKNECNELDTYLSKIQTPRYKHTVLFFNFCFEDEGTFDFYTHTRDLSLGDKISVRKFYEQNIFNENSGESIIKIADAKNNSFLMQPSVWAIIEADKEVIREGYEEALFKLTQFEGELKGIKFQLDNPSQYEILFRYAIPMGMGWKLCMDFIYDNTGKSSNTSSKIFLQLHYTHQQNIDLKFQSYDRNFFLETYHMLLSAEHFIEFLHYGPILPILMTNPILKPPAEDIQSLPEDHSRNCIGNMVKNKLFNNFTIQDYFQEGIQTLRIY